MKRLPLFLILLALMIAAPAAAQDAAPDDDPFPTLTALQNTPIPPLDPVDTARRLRGVDAPPALPPVGEPLPVGTQQMLWASNSSAMRTFQVPATLLAVGDHSYIWVEDNRGVSQAEAESLARQFDVEVYDQVRRLWGSEANPGIDGDPRLHIFLVGDLGFTVGAYFALRHTYPDEVLPASNEREMFFVNLDAYAGAINSGALVNTLAHEFQHMIRHNLDGNEDTWLNEGFSAFTEYYLGDSSSYRYPGAFLSQPETQLNSFGLGGTARLNDYGAGFMFVTYFYHRFGEAGLHKLSAQTNNGLIAADTALRDLGQFDGVDAFFADFALANLIQDATIDDGRYGYPADLPLQPVPVWQPRGTQPRWSDQLPPYSTRYYDASGSLGAGAVQVTLDLPREVPLIPTQAASGQRMWYSNRADTSNMTLTRAFDLRDVTSATLSFNAWYAIEELWDFAYVMVSTDDGQRWTPLSSDRTTTENPFGNAHGPAYTGYSRAWVTEQLSLDAYAGQEILLRFEYITDDAVNEPGFALDDVAIPEIGYSSDFEADGGGWQSEGWLWMDNRLPGRAWVQAISFTPTGVEVVRWLADATDSSWTLTPAPGTERLVIAVSPIAPVTTEPVPFTLTVIPAS